MFLEETEFRIKINPAKRSFTREAVPGFQVVTSLTK